MTVRMGKTVYVSFVGTLNDGTVFDSTNRQGEPFVIKIGGGGVLTEFEQAIMGMKKGEEKEITLPPLKDYGDHDPALVRKVTRDRLDEDEHNRPRTGAMVLMVMDNGAKKAGWISAVTDESVFIDLNHPMVGRQLNYKVKILDIY